MPNFPFTVGDSLRIGTADITASGGNIVLPSGTQVGNQPVATTVEVSTGGGPKITNIQVTSNVYVVLDDTAVDTAGGFIKITGTNFVTGCMVYVASTPANSTTFVNSTEVRAAVPATSAGTYPLYLVNPDGGTAIRVPGLTFSANPAWQTASALPEQYDGVAINLSLVATEATLYTLVSGSLPPGLSLNSNTGVISGTITDVANDTVYSFTITATDAQLQDSPRTFTVTITVSDAYFKLTTLLLSGSAIPVNTVIRDSSTNNFNLTVFGDARASNFTPYGTGWSVYFDGTGDVLTIPDSAISQLGSSDFTVECWINTSKTTGGSILSKGVDENVTWGNFAFSLTSSGYLFFEIDPTPSTSADRFSLTDTVAINNGQWHHVAVTRSGNNWKLFRNGTIAASGTSSASFSDDTYAWLVGGSRVSGSAVATWVGYISNLRLIKGSAVYTTAFTPPTAPLTAITNTAFLICHANRFLDGSTNNFTITRNGDARIVSFNPFNITNTGVDGSMYFDGSGDTVSIPANTALAMGTGDFTWEFWIYPTVLAQSFIYGYRSGGAGGPQIQFTTTNTYFGSDAGDYITVSGTPTLFSWTHFVLVRAGSGTNNTSMYWNGVLKGQATNTLDFNSTGPYYIGSANNTNYFFTGYIANARIIKGTAVYTGAFTPPTQPLTAVANTQLLTLQYDQPSNNHTFLDSSSNQFLITRSGNATQGTFSPFSQAGWSYYFDGSSSYVGFEGGGTLQLHTGDLTIEFWFNMGKDQNVSQGQGPSLMRKSTSSISYGRNIQWMIGTWTDGSMGFSMYNYDTGIGVGTNGLDVGDNRWHHAAFTRQGDTLRSFFDGQLRQTATFTGSANSTDWTTYIGANDATNVNPYKGYLSNVRILKGTALYTANFTPSTSSLQDIANCSLLTANSNRFRDTSSLNQTASPSGTNYVIPFSPFGPSAVYSPATHGGSAYVNATSTYLALPASTPLVNIADWTVDFWMYPTSYVNAQGIFGASNGGGASLKISFQINGSSISLYKTGTAIISISQPPLNQWTHLSVVRSSSTGLAYIFVNGVLGTSGSFGSEAVTSNFQLFTNGEGATSGMYGYLSSFRVSNIARQVTAFTVPTQPYQADTNTILLTNFTDSAILDSTGRQVLETVADARTSSVVTKFTGGSMYFDGTGDRLVLPASPNLTFGTSDFTIEMWVNSAAQASNSARIMGNGAGGSWGANKWIFTSTTASNPNKYAFQFWNYNSGGSDLLVSSSTANNSTWTHVVITRSGSTFRMFVNGTLEATQTSANSLDGSSSVYLEIGRSGLTGEDWAGYINDLRITKGYARYTANFTAPTASARLK